MAGAIQLGKPPETVTTASKKGDYRGDWIMTSQLKHLN
jgi:hypothetical protein